jgi:hypothetical protein
MFSVFHTIIVYLVLSTLYSMPSVLYYMLSELCPAPAR